MARSLWKGPFVDGYLLKKADAARGGSRNEVVKIWSRRSTILPQFVGITFGVHNGHKHIPVYVTEEMVSFRRVVGGAGALRRDADRSVLHRGPVRLPRQHGCDDDGDVPAQQQRLSQGAGARSRRRIPSQDAILRTRPSRRDRPQAAAREQHVRAADRHRRLRRRAPG